MQDAEDAKEAKPFDKTPRQRKSSPKMIFEELSIYFYLRSCYIISRLRFCFFQMMMAM